MLQMWQHKDWQVSVHANRKWCAYQGFVGAGFSVTQLPYLKSLDQKYTKGTLRESASLPTPGCSIYSL